MRCVRHDDIILAVGHIERIVAKRDRRRWLIGNGTVTIGSGGDVTALGKPTIIIGVA